MRYRFVEGGGGSDLVSVGGGDGGGGGATALIPAITTTPAPGEEGVEVGGYECADTVLADLHRFMQDGARLFEDSEDEDHGAGGCDEGDGKRIDLEAFLRELSERAARMLVLLEEEGVVPLDALELAREISGQCRSFAGDRDAIDRDGFEALLGKTADFLKAVRPVDLDLLLRQLRDGKDAGDTMQGKDILLLIGQTGCGKTSTIHYLAGSTFKECIVNGFDHLELVNVVHPKLRNAKTSTSTRSVTRSVHSIDITTECGKTLAICDTPGFNDTDGIETDIANGFGMIKAIQGANKVKPVLVLSEKGIGDRFGAMSQDLRTISKLVGAGPDGAVDPEPFAYVFTKYDAKYAGRLHEQFKAKYNELTAAEREDPSFRDFVLDIRSKTKPVANIVAPLDENNRSTLLSSLIEGKWYDEPASTFSPFVSGASLNTLKDQLQNTCTAIHMALDRNDATLVSTKLLQLVELGRFLPDATVFATQGVECVSGFLGRCKESLLSSIEKCKEYRDHDNAFRQELKSARETVEVLVAFHPISSKWSSFQDSGDLHAGSDFCAWSIATLTNSLEERVFSRRDDADVFITALRQQKQAAVTDLSRIKDIADAFTHLTHVVPTPVRLFEECSRALDHSIIALVQKHLTAREAFGFGTSGANAGQFMPTSVLHDVQADFDLFCIVGDLEARGVILDGHERFSKLWRDSIAAMDRNLQNKISAATEQLSLSDRDVKTMVTLDCHAIADVRRVLSFLVSQPAFSSLLVQMKAEPSAQKLKELEASIASFVLLLVVTVEAEFNIAKVEDNEAKLRQIEQHLAKADSICSFCNCDKEGKRVAVLGKSLHDHMESLSAKQQSILERAKHFLHVVDTQDAASILPELAAAYDEWKVVFTRAPEVKKPGMVKRLFSVIGWANSNESSSKESDFVLTLKTTRDKIGRGLQRQLKRSCQDIPSPSSVLFLVKVITVENTALISWTLEKNTTTPNRLFQMYRGAQIRLSQYVGSSSLDKFLTARDFITLNSVLNDMRKYEQTWQEVKETAKRIDPKNYSQRRLRDELLAIKDYTSNCQYLLSEIQRRQRAFSRLSFLDDARTNSINEHDHNELYREVVSSLSFFEGIQDLRGHLPSVADHAPLEHVEKQIECIYRYLEKLMAAFPNIETDFQKIYITRSNFRSIEGCFTEEPQIAGTARRFRDDIDRKMLLLLRSIEPPTEMSNITPILILLKKASINIACWRPDINKSVDELLLKMSKIAPNGGHFILRLELELKNVQGDDETVALQILSEHKCFEGAMNAVFNSATARQGIEYVVDSIELSAEARDALLLMYSTFQKQYKGLIEKGLVASKSDEKMKLFFRELVDEAKTIALDYSIDYRSQLTSLTSFIFAHWSLRSMNSFVSDTMSNEDTCDAAIEYLMKPHAAQVVSIWLLLNFEHAQYRIIENHFIEVLTGEGKSIALGVTAIILAMLDCDVVCVCYSSYLSSRDFDSFESMFEEFGVLRSIKYSTLKDACGEMYNAGGDTRSLSEDICWGEKSKCDDSGNSKGRARVLLIDEVDMFFQKDFYGGTYRSAGSLFDQSIENLLKYIWTNRGSLNETSLLTSPTAHACLDLFPEDIQPIISKHIANMLRDAINVDSHNYIVHDGAICYKEFDGLDRHSVYRYLTTFAGIKEHENGNVTKEAMKRRLCIFLKCGRSSYAEIPTAFDGILGVTGTLASLGQDEKDILSHQYGINKMTYIPSVYGKNKLKFAGDCPKDVIIADDDANFHLELRNEINARRKPDKEGSPLRAVMAFFESREELEDFYESDPMSDIKPITRILTEEIAPRDKEGAFLQCTRSGAITLMIRDYGRGTDFLVFDSSMLDGGGVHVIQAFFSSEIAEETQIKGRTARQGARGSYSMVLHANSLEENLGLVTSDVEKMRLQSRFYSYLDSKRSNAYAEFCKERRNLVEEAERSHYETVDYKQCALQDRRQDALVYLEKWNGVASVTPPSVATKTSFLAQKCKRMAEIEEVEKNKRAEASSKKDPPHLPSDDGNDSVEDEEFFDASDDMSDFPIANGDDTHYSVLGVSLNADVREIECAYRRATLSCHPDRNDHPSARDRFLRLAEAKMVLSCPVKRRNYDAELRRI
ncbi:hypothetical protein ACHAWF_018746 [Thalassiosira exigua]